MTRNAEAYLRMRLQRARDVTQMAASIMEDPQWIISALVEAGILIDASTKYVMTTKAKLYELADSPHVHRWTVFFGKSNAETLFLVCDSNDRVCSENRTVPNRFPIQTPE